MISDECAFEVSTKCAFDECGLRAECPTGRIWPTGRESYGVNVAYELSVLGTSALRAKSGLRAKCPTGRLSYGANVAYGPSVL